MPAPRYWDVTVSVRKPSEKRYAASVYYDWRWIRSPEPQYEMSFCHANLGAVKIRFKPMQSGTPADGTLSETMFQQEWWRVCWAKTEKALENFHLAMTRLVLEDEVSRRRKGKTGPIWEFTIYLCLGRETEPPNGISLSAWDDIRGLEKGRCSIPIGLLDPVPPIVSIEAEILAFIRKLGAEPTKIINPKRKKK
jgi:hypothetical protein